MNIEMLEEYIDKNKYCLEFETDGVGFTWGISYIRLTVGQKSKFDNIEHFFFSALKSEKNITSGIFGGPSWEARTNIKEWAKGLQVVDVSIQDLLDFINNSIKEITENLKDWENENSIEMAFLNSSLN